MNCDDVRERLSAYHDQELDATAAAAVRTHLQRCEACAQERQGFERLSQLVSAPRLPADSPNVTWEVFAAKWDATRPQNHRDAQVASAVGGQPRRSVGGLAGWLTLAASIAIAVVWIGQHNRPVQALRGDRSVHAGHDTPSRAGAIDLASVVEQFRYGADAAVAALSRQTAGEIAASKPAQAVLVQARPVSARTFALAACRCGPGECTCGPDGCHCVACVYRRADDSELLVLQHCPGQAVSFGDLPRRERRHGQTLVQESISSGHRIASWSAAGRKFTAVGLKDATEIDSLLASTEPNF